MTKSQFKPPGTKSARTEKSLLNSFDDHAAIAGKENGRTCALSASDLLDSG